MLQPIGKNVLLKIAPVNDKTAGGIIIKHGKREQKGEVIAKGNQVTLVNEGQTVYFQHGDFKLIKHKSVPDDADYAIVLEDHIVGILEE